MGGGRLRGVLALSGSTVLSFFSFVDINAMDSMVIATKLT